MKTSFTSIHRFRLASLLLLSAGALNAASNTNLERLIPFIDPYTVVIAELNLRDLDVAGSTAELAKLVPEPRQFLAEPLKQVERFLGPWHQEFRAAGGEKIYVLLSLAQLGTEQPVIIVAPLTRNADAERLKASLGIASPDWHPQVMHGCVVTAPDSLLRRLQAGAAPASVVRWQAAFDAAPEGLARVAMVPYAESDRVLTDLLPTLPPMLGGGPGSVVTRGFQWGALTVKLPPAGALALTIQSDSPESAVALRQVIERGFDALSEAREVKEHFPAWSNIRTLLIPQVASDRLECRLEFAQLAEVIRGLQPALDEARTKAYRIQMVNQLKQIGLGLIIQAGEQADRLPPHLVDILKYIGGDARLFLNPAEGQIVPPDFANLSREEKLAWIDSHTPFVYLRPGVSMKEIQSPMNAVLVYQRPTPGGDSRIGVLFADGHVDLVTPRQLQEILDNSGIRPQ